MQIWNLHTNKRQRIKNRAVTQFCLHYLPKGKHITNNKQKRADEWVARFLRLCSSGVLCICYALVYCLSLIGCPQTRQVQATTRRSRVPVILFPYSILFFNLSNKQAVWLWLRLGVCMPCCRLSWQSSSRVCAAAPAFLSHYALEWVV